MTKLYFEVIFTDWSKPKQIISIGIVADNGESFYGECDDFNRAHVSENINMDIMKNMCNGLQGKITNYHYGNSDSILTNMYKWIIKFGPCVLISDDSANKVNTLYAIQPALYNNGISNHDVDEDIADHYKITIEEARELYGEDILAEFLTEVHKGRYTAVHMARVIKAVHRRMTMAPLEWDSIERQKYFNAPKSKTTIHRPSKVEL